MTRTHLQEEHGLLMQDKYGEVVGMLCATQNSQTKTVTVRVWDIHLYITCALVQKYRKIDYREH